MYEQEVSDWLRENRIRIPEDTINLLTQNFSESSTRITDLDLIGYKLNNLPVSLCELLEERRSVIILLDYDNFLKINNFYVLNNEYITIPNYEHTRVKRASNEEINLIMNYVANPANLNEVLAHAGTLSNFDETHNIIYNQIVTGNTKAIIAWDAILSVNPEKAIESFWLYDNNLKQGVRELPAYQKFKQHVIKATTIRNNQVTPVLL